MLFEETLAQYKNEVKQAVDELFSKAFSNQINETDLLLILENGLKLEYPPETLKRLNITPYFIGAERIGFRYSSFYKYINQYRTTIFKKSEHIEELNKQHSDRNYLYDFLIEQELLLYLKFWETDLILRRLYNLSRLARGLEYDWNYNQRFFNERRKIVKEEIQLKLKDITPKFYQLIEDIYSRQLRNAIGHSQYYMLYDKICLTNRKENNLYKLDSVSYNDWEILFHKNILFYNYLIGSFNEYSKIYQDQVLDKQNGLLITFPDNDYKGNRKIGWMKYNIRQKRWLWNN